MPYARTLHEVFPIYFFPRGTDSNQVGLKTPQKIKQFSNMGLEHRIFISTTEAENKQRCPCSQETKKAKGKTFICITFGIPLLVSVISHLITKL